MTTREIYFKNLIKIDLPCGLIGYTYFDDMNHIQIGKNVNVKFRTDEKTVSESIELMKEVEKSEGFMFWNSSPEGEEFFNKNWNEISNGLKGIFKI